MVTVIITTFNRLDLLVRAVYSVLAQTYTDYQILIVDDGSTDGTQAYFERLSLPHLTYIYKANEGVSRTWNFALTHVHTPYIAFLDSDDYWLPDKLEKQMRHFASNPSSALVYTNFYLDFDNGIDTKTKFEFETPQNKFVRPLFVDYIPIQISTVLAKYEAFQKVGFFEPIGLGDDVFMWHKLSEHYSLDWIEDVTMVMNVNHRNGITHVSSSPEVRKKKAGEFEQYWNLYRERYAHLWTEAELAGFKGQFDARVRELTK